MLAMTKGWVATLVVGAALVTGAAEAAVVFEDQFDGEVAGTTLNYNSFVKWDVLNGAVDLIAQGGFSLSCLGGAGKCVDLDGSSNNAGDLRSKLVIGPGIYEFEFWISGNQRGGANDTLTVTFGDMNENFIMAAADPYAQIIRVVTVGGAGDRILFSHAGNDNVGVMLDGVIVREAVAVPEIDTRILLIGGLGLLAILIAPQRLATLRYRHRRRSRPSSPHRALGLARLAPRT